MATFRPDVFFPFRAMITRSFPNQHPHHLHHHRRCRAHNISSDQLSCCAFPYGSNSIETAITSLLFVHFYNTACVIAAAAEMDVPFYYNNQPKDRDFTFVLKSIT